MNDGNHRPSGILCVGASAGGVPSLTTFVAGLPNDLDAAVLVVLHLSRQWRSSLDRILDRAGSLPAWWARDGEPLRPGVVFVAPPDRHLLVAAGRVEVVRGPTEHLARPAIDPTFRSAAAAFDRRVVAAVLSGTGQDGAAGAAAVKRAGGRVIVQDPAEADFGEMPARTIERVPVDAVAGAADLGGIAASMAGNGHPREARAGGPGSASGFFGPGWGPTVLGAGKRGGPGAVSSS